MGYIKIDAKNFFENLEIVSKKAGSKKRVALVLKDNAYGHGLEEMAALAYEFGIEKAVVRNMAEALKIEKLFGYILVLSEIPQEKPIPNIGITVNCIEDLKKIPPFSTVELKIDTGMHRNGIELSETKEAFDLIKKRGLVLRGVFTHFRSADELSTELFWQKKRFEKAKKRVLELCYEFGFERPLFHSCNSAALFRSESFDEDFARVGIAAYGYLESDEVFDMPELKPVLSLWGEKIASKRLKKGQRLGYGGVFEADRDIVVSTYDIGYADGFFRLDGSREYILPGGEKILGRVSMDSMSIDSQKQEICIIDDAKKCARFFNTISYEILVKLSPFLKRVVNRQM
ncbi:alanine racemase [Nitrosophilus alvini]|uniref:alanine racemase n=1 Tax=Nitrosophilus alvini TaxID=2714855 RepID=UPI00190AD28B|nr:alanine racemase [Nitrosophilus alvini]